MKCCPGVTFSVSTWVKQDGVTREFQLGVKLMFFSSFHPSLKLYLERFEAYFTKMFYGKFMRLQDYIKTMMLDFVNKRSKIFNFKTS